MPFRPYTGYHSKSSLTYKGSTMSFFAQNTDTCDKLADKAIIQTEHTLTGLIDALRKSDEAVGHIDNQLETLMRRKDQIIKRSERLESMIDALSEALHPVDPNETVINA